MNICQCHNILFSTFNTSCLAVCNVPPTSNIDRVQNVYANLWVPSNYFFAGDETLLASS